MTAWREKTADLGVIEELEKADYNRIIARLLAIRGISLAKCEEFFDSSMKRLMPPNSLPGITEATTSILDAIKARRQIVIFGDYDCDGVCATAILTKALREIERPLAHAGESSSLVEPFLPQRLTEGYGMTAASIDRMLRQNPKVSLVVTVDNGINSVAQVSYLQQRGIEVIVTDHHLPGQELPPCTIVDPKLASPKELEGICGAGVAFFLANCLIVEAKRRGWFPAERKISAPLLVMAGLATITDIMPLVDQNRIIVANALQLFNRYAPIGLRELMYRAPSRELPENATVQQFGFLLGPRINAAGRMDTADAALDLLLEEDRDIAREAAIIVDKHNGERRTTEKDMTDLAIKQIVEGASAQVIAIPGGHIGVAGIVASKVMEELKNKKQEQVPVCIIVGTHGSGRAPAGYNLCEAFNECGQHLSRFGGHAVAGGLSVKEGHIDEFRAAFCRACEIQRNRNSIIANGTKYVDAVVDLREITQELADEILTLEPFGEANPEPVFCVRQIIIPNVCKFGNAENKEKHLKIEFEMESENQKKQKLVAIWWNHGSEADTLKKNLSLPHDIIFTLRMSGFKNNRYIQHLELEDII